MKSVVITGASSGIGRATALQLDRRGYRVFAGVRREEYARELREAASERLTPVILDVTIEDQIVGATALVKESIGDEAGLDGLVNNAGIAVLGCGEFCALEEFRRQLEVNVTGQLAVTQAFAPLVRKAPGRIVFVGSANGHFALPYMGAYATSKFAIEGLADSLRREFHPWGIPVILIEPGTVEAKMWERSPTADDVLSRMPEEGRRLHAERMHLFAEMMSKGRKCAAQPEALAAVIVKALEARRPRARYQRGPGSIMAILGSRMPDWFQDWILESMLTKKLPTWIMGW